MKINHFSEKNQFFYRLFSNFDPHCMCLVTRGRAVVKSTFVESKTSPSPKRFESESRPSPKRFESKTSPSPKRFESESSPSPKRFKSKSSPSPKRFESESSPSQVQVQMRRSKQRKKKIFFKTTYLIIDNLCDTRDGISSILI